MMEAGSALMLSFKQLKNSNILVSLHCQNDGRLWEGKIQAIVIRFICLVYKMYFSQKMGSQNHPDHYTPKVINLMPLVSFFLYANISQLDMGHKIMSFSPADSIDFNSPCELVQSIR